MAPEIREAWIQNILNLLESMNRTQMGDEDRGLRYQLCRFLARAVVIDVSEWIIP